MTTRRKRTNTIDALRSQITEAVKFYMDRRPEFEILAKTLLMNLAESPLITQLIHSTKYRTKDPAHLKDKLQRKAAEAVAAGKTLDITKENIFTKIEDLAGVRLLHLHTKQMADIHSEVIRVLDEHKYRLVGKPVANTWDIENQEYFKSLGLRANLRPSMYTSVHYIIKANRRTEMCCELQVRTLMEEVWGEVSHTINYPYETNVLCCREQLRVLARAASGCTRLVDSIFASHEDHKRPSIRLTKKKSQIQRAKSKL
jgi:putative GTP pyrophosphokinase